MPGICTSPFISVICPPSGGLEIFQQEFPDSHTPDLVVTVNGGVIPAPTNAYLWVFQNGQKISEGLGQYAVVGSTIEVNPLTHWDGSNYEIFLFVV